MKSKEEIFNEHSFKELGAISPSKRFCLPAMEEFAKQEAIGFKIWFNQDREFFMSSGYNNDELYNLYLESKKQKA